MIRFVTVLAASLLLSMQLAFAQDTTLSFANEPALSYEHLGIEGHQVYYPGYTYTGFGFADSVSFYCRQYGDVGDLIGSVVVFGPQTENTRRIEEVPESAVVYSTSLFNLSDAPTDGGWFTVPIELLKLPEDGFSIVVYTRSNEERGIDMGLAPSITADTQSYTQRVLTTEEIEEDPEAAQLKRRDGMEWMIRTHVRVASGLGSGISSDDLSGASFGHHDDGTAEAWEEFQRNGAMVRFDNDRKRSIDAIYIHAKLGADWFGTDRECSVTVLDERYNIIKRTSIPFLAFNETGSWARLEMPSREVPPTFYVLVQPHSEKNVQFLLGVDTSGNQSSFVGTTGAPLEWLASSPEADSNWMVRVHYSR